MLPKTTSNISPTVAFSLLVGVATSFLTFQTIITALSTIDPNALVPCNEGCTFIRYFGGGGIPASAPVFLDCGNGSGADSVHYCNSTSPIEQNLCPLWLDEATSFGFIKIVNGERDIQYSRMNMNQFDWFARLWNACVEPYNHAYTTPVCPDLDEPMHTFCNRPETKANFHNHLIDAPSLKALRVCLCVWFFFLAIHELLVLYQFPDNTTLLMGICSTAAHIATTACAFLWSTGATEVFLAEDDSRPCGCYYELPGLACLIMLASPALLQKTAWDMMWKTALGSIHGDFFHTVVYSVPARVVQSSELTDPTTTFLPPTVKGDTQHAQPLDPQVVKVEVGLLNFLKFFQANVSVAVIVFCSATPLMAKVMTITHDGVQVILLQHFTEWTSPSVGVAVALTMACVFGPFYCCYKQKLVVQKQAEQVYTMCWKWNTYSFGLPKSERATLIIVSVTAVLVPVLSILYGIQACFAFLGVWQTAALHVTPDLATQWGEHGVQFVAMFVSSYCYASLPWKFLQDGFKIKQGEVPILGLNHIVWLDEQFPILGLTNERQLAQMFMHKINPEMNQHPCICDEEKFLNADYFKNYKSKPAMLVNDQYCDEETKKAWTRQIMAHRGGNRGGNRNLTEPLLV